MTSRLMEFTKLSQAYTHLSRLLACRQKEYPVTVANHQCKIMLSPCERQISYGYQLILDVNNTPLTLNLDSIAVDNLLPGKLEHNAVTSLPVDLLKAALHHNLDSSLQALSQAFNLSISIVGFSTNKDAAQESGLLIKADMGGAICTGTVTVTDALLSFIEMLPEVSRADVAVPYLASLEIGRSLLTAAEIKDIEVGDIVFVQQHVTEQYLIVRLDRHTAFIAKAEGNQMTIQQRMLPMENEHSEEVQEPSEQQEGRSEAQEGQGTGSGIDVSDMSVELVFEIGRQQFNINELQELEPGFVFELDRPIEQPVQIRTNGKVIAECQIVQIENRLGAKITKLK